MRLEPKKLIPLNGSLAVILPACWLKTNNMKEGDSITVTLSNKKITITKAS